MQHATGFPPSADRPAHVPLERVHDFDMSPSGGVGGDVHRYWKSRAQDDGPDIFWTPHHDGHWVVSRAADIEAIQQQPDLFSNAEFVIPRGVVPRLIPLQLDPPEHTAYRRLIMPFFVPRALGAIEQKARAVAVRLIEEVRPQGGCEFVGAFAGVMPVIAFLTMMQLPEDDLAMLRDLATRASKPHHPGSAEAWASMSAYIAGWIERRRLAPGDDPLSVAIHGKVDGAPVPDDAVFSMCLLLLGGGLDTVASMMSFIAHHLATHPQHQQILRERRDLIPNAVQEFARRYGLSNLARVVTREAEFGGVKFMPGDLVLVPMPLVGLDERVTPDPLDVVLDRPRPHHSAFGIGPHACPGRVLAQHELAIFIEEWLDRLPAFELDTDRPPVFTTSLINSVEALYLRW